MKKCTLYDVVKKALIDVEKTRKIAKNGREMASNIFTSENNAKQVCQLYEKILKKDKRDGVEDR